MPSWSENSGQSGARVAIRATAEQLAQLKASSLEQTENASPNDLRDAMYALRVHQIELEMQNEELQRAQAALEISRARYFELYDLAPVGYLTIGENGVVREANLTAAHLLGLVRSEIVQQRFSNFVFPEDQNTFYLQRRQLLDLGTPQVCELRMTRRGAEAFWVRMEASLVRDAATVPTIHAAISDISERKQAEDAQAQLQAQLAHAQKMEAVGALAGGIAHDFNNILTGILGGLSLLEMDLVDGEHQADIDEMKGLVVRAANLTQSLLGFARRGKNDVRSLDLALAVEKAAELFGRTRKDITIRREVGHDLHSVVMDRTQLEQVLLNLFINAGQAMPGGGSVLVSMTNAEVSAEQVGSLGAPRDLYVVLVIADTGVGMDAATQARIFEPFFTTKDVGKGTGLGLASVYGIVKSHGGHIKVASHVGHGTVFTLQLPATDARPSAETVPPAPMERGSETILIVDDEEHVRNVCSRMLTRMGYNVLVASGGREALELVQLHGDAISLIILDMTMPEMSGAETYKELRKVAPHTKVLLSSGHSLEGQAQEMMTGGCQGFIQKPFNLAKLTTKVQETLRAGAQARKS